MPDNFEIKENAELGRYSCAAKHIVAGEILFEELPFVVGPKPNTHPVCLGCCHPIDGSADGPRCPQCRWPLCETCIDDDLHRKECQLFVENKVRFHDFPDSENACMQLDCITPLRLLLEKESNGKRWNEEICLMEHHRSIRYRTQQWNADQQNVVKYLLGPCKLKGRFSEELIQQACGILEVNSFEARTKSGHKVRCIFPKTAIMAHSCVPNTTHSIYPSDRFKIVVRASVDINHGGMLHTTYTDLLVGTALRQDHLTKSKFFTCRCKRCNDPTELGTHFSSFKCHKCISGFLHSTDPYEQKCEWKCSSCDFKSKMDAIETALSIMHNEVDRAQSIEFGTERLAKCELLFRKYRTLLHPQHYIQTGLSQNLIEMYGRVEGHELEKMADAMLQRKIDLVFQVLSILDVIYPGKTRARGMLLYEMYRPLVFLARNAYAAGVWNISVYRSKIHEAITLLEECTEILGWEDETTTEFVVGQIGKKALAQLKNQLDSGGD